MNAMYLAIWVLACTAVGSWLTGLALWANRRLSCVGWAFYRMAFALAERKRVLDSVTTGSCPYPPLVMAWMTCPAQHDLLDPLVHARLHGTLTAPSSSYAAVQVNTADPRHNPWTGKL